MTTDRLTPADAIQIVKDRNIKMLDLKFVDVPGTLRAIIHATVGCQRNWCRRSAIMGHI